jgi:hypothetical protein
MVYTLTFGKYKGMTMDEVYQVDSSYVSWLADKSYVAPARRAAEAVIAASARKDDETDGHLIASLNLIAKSKPHPHLKAYKYIHTDVCRDYACIEFCTHDIHTPGGFINDVFMDEDWDIVTIATHHEGLDEVDEEEEYLYGHEQPRYKARKTGPVPTAEAAIWYAMRDNSEHSPLNEQPVSMAEAIELLEQYLASK